MLVSVAGGMSSNRRWTPPPALPGGQAPVRVPAQAVAGAARHCFVINPAGHPGKWPGLLVEWRRPSSTNAWLGRVMYAVQADGQTQLAEAWLGQEHLAQA